MAHPLITVRRLLKSWATPPAESSDAFHLMGLPKLLFQLFVLSHADEKSDRSGCLAARTLKQCPHMLTSMRLPSFRLRRSSRPRGAPRS